MSAMEVRGGLGGSHGKCHGRRVDQYPQKDIPLCRFQKEFQVVPCQNQNNNQRDQRHRTVGAYTDDSFPASATSLAIRKERGDVGHDEPQAV